MAVQKFQTGYRLFLGERINQIIDVINGVTAGVFKGVFNGTVGATTPSTGVFTTLTAANFTQTGLSTTAVQLAAAAGSNSQSGATLITKSTVIAITVSATTRAFRLPTATTGLRVTLLNGGANATKIYPGTNARIGAAATNAVGTAIGVNKGNLYVAQSATTWRVMSGA